MPRFTSFAYQSQRFLESRRPPESTAVLRRVRYRILRGSSTLAGEEFSTTYFECAAGRGDAFTNTTCLIFKESTATPRGLAKVDDTWSLGNVDKADDHKLRLTEPPQVFRPAGKRRKQPKRRKGNR